jgi:micrococcal nuclease
MPKPPETLDTTSRRPRPRRYGPDWVAGRLRRRRRIRWASFVLLLILAATALLDRSGTFGRRGDDWITFDQKTFTVTHVVDGDTIEIATPHGQPERVRLIGVDAPETNGRENGEPDHWASEATGYAEARAEGKNVTLRLDGTQTRDRYGRLLAYVYLGDAESLNLALVRDGYAYSDRRFGHTHRSEFEQAEAAARKKASGLWKTLRDEQMPRWRQDWLDRQRAASNR